MQVIKYLCLVLFIVVLSGCYNNDKSTINSYLSLMGESETWKVEQYKISITSEILKAGDGILKIKDKNQYTTDFFDLEVHAVMDYDDRVIQKKTITGSENLTEVTTGTIEGGTYLDKDGKALVSENISEVYMIIEWQNMNKGKRVIERIDLFKRSLK
ncbi:hypothetical protein M3194_18520 [Paenibacillus glycanilyticus]|uniref:hypothetical protein n=1 Tax=Paenibacillus glycanilyticus TaxID=126569 RepID=UPI002041CB23|nr:hypothetical protein [Paenibacillus glycanilyticus]MCM3629342.1 hypothetical protein [Paenibacillus glycanilyticus]